MVNRREFVKGLGAAAGVAAMGGCKSPCGGRTFYGPTVRDRLWMWGHHPACVKEAGWGFPKHGFANAKFVDQAEGCRLMGIPNNCFSRCADLPKYPCWDYFDQFKGLDQLGFEIIGCGPESVWEKMRICFEEIQPRCKNLTTCLLDDFFSDPALTLNETDLAKVAEQVHAHDLRLSMVFYSDYNGFKPEYRNRLRMCDEVSVWFWEYKYIETMAENVKRTRDFIGGERDLLLGLYMWDFPGGNPISGELMAKQLEYARKFLADRTIDGIVFHPTFVAGLDLDAVKVSKAWIKANADRPWGV